MVKYMRTRMCNSKQYLALSEVKIPFCDYICKTVACHRALAFNRMDVVCK